MKKMLFYSIRYLVYFFSFLFPRKKNKWIFGSTKGFFDGNAKYLFIYVTEHRLDINAMWISKDKEIVAFLQGKGLQAYYTYSVLGVWNALTSKFWFFNFTLRDISICFSGGVTAICLWHGVGLKKILFDKESFVKDYAKHTLKKSIFSSIYNRKPDYLVSSTHFQAKIFSSSFRCSESKCLELGYPRNIVFSENESLRKNFIFKFEPESTLSLIENIKRNYKKTYIYLPTWRDSSRNVFIQSLDLDTLNNVLKEKESLLIIKPHHRTIHNENGVLNLTNIIVLNDKVDLYPILPYTDVLITDYSSILYDYILMEGKDVVLYLYDYADYAKRSGFIAPFDENVVGKRVSSFTELCDCIYREDYKINEEERRRIIEKFWGESARINSSAAIADFVTNIYMKRGQRSH